MNKDWKFYFYEISKIPRRSGQEEKIKNYLVKFAIDRNLEYYVDKINNVIIWKNSSNVCNNEETIGLQAHVDMVCEKTRESKHDFSKDAIEIIEENGFLKAKDTTLGADNGIGVAYILSILDSNTIKCPNIEAIFTVQEETTMNGVKFLDKNKIKSTKIISFDNFNENEIWIGSASSNEWYTELNANIIKKNNINTYKLSLSNFIGGHAGMDIGDEERGNPIKVAFEILKDMKIYINYIKAGSLINVIPNECDVVFSLEYNNEDYINIINNNINIMNYKYKNVNIKLEKIKKQKDMIDCLSSRNLINCINDLKTGAVHRGKRGNVIVGVNLAKLSLKNGKINMNFCLRGNERNLTKKCVEDIDKKILKKYNFQVLKYDEWKGYEQSEDNELIKITKEAFINKKQEKINVLGVQACLECEFFGEKIKQLQYVALGTNTFDVHSTNERVEIASIERTWEIIQEILKNLF